MEEIFNKLKGEKGNTVSNLIKWILSANILPQGKSSEDKILQLFSGVADTNNVELPKFQEVLGKLATEQNKSIGELTGALATGGNFLQGSAVQDGLKMATNALAGAFK